MECCNCGQPAFGPLPIAFLLALDSVQSVAFVMALTAVLAVLIVRWVIVCLIVCISAYAI